MKTQGYPAMFACPEQGHLFLSVVICCHNPYDCCTTYQYDQNNLILWKIVTPTTD